ncbi:MAG: hypothetical protein R3F14_32205 [Polyangiaceae bacterium]
MDTRPDETDDYWPGLFGPRPVLPFVAGMTPFVCTVAFFALFHSGRDPLEALQVRGQHAI